MNYTNLGGSIFNLDHIVMVEPYDNGETISGWVHCTDDTPILSANPNIAH